MAPCRAMICHQVTLSGDAEWPKVADAVIEAPHSMPRKLYKFKLLLDENMPPRQRFPRLNSRFDLKHIRDDLHQAGLKDPPVYSLAGKLKRLIITFNGDDFKHMVVQSTQTGVINLSTNLRNDQI